MPVAKILNLWDRSLGFLLMAVFATVGLILSATCTGIATYCASQVSPLHFSPIVLYKSLMSTKKVFYSVGFSGMIFCVDVITADTSTLRDRGLAYAFTSSPYIITAYAGSAASQHFYETNWRWAYGCFAIVLPVVALPMFGLLQYNRYKAKKKGLLRKKEASGRSLMQSIIFYTIEFDSKILTLAKRLRANICSPGCVSSDRWTGPFPASFHHRWIYGRRLEVWFHHYDACDWHRMLDCLFFGRALPCSSALSSMEIIGLQNGSWCLSHRCLLPDRILLLGRLLHLLSAGRVRNKYRSCRIHKQHLRRGFWSLAFSCGSSD